MLFRDGTKQRPSEYGHDDDVVVDVGGCVNRKLPGISFLGVFIESVLDRERYDGDSGIEDEGNEKVEEVTRGFGGSRRGRSTESEGRTVEAGRTKVVRAVGPN